MILWEYRIVYKISMGQTSFKLVYGQEAIMPLNFKQQSPTISQVLHLDLQGTQERMFNLQKLEEKRMIDMHH